MRIYCPILNYSNNGIGFMDGIVANDIKSYATVQKQINDVYIQLNQLGRVANKSGLSDEVS